MERDDLKNIEAFCPDEKCGDPVPAMGGGQSVNRTKRKMTFSGFNFLDRAVYRCPVCGRERKFAIAMFADKYVEVNI